MSAEPLASPFTGPAFLARELVPGALEAVEARVRYPPPFGAGLRGCVDHGRRGSSDADEEMVAAAVARENSSRMGQHRGMVIGIDRRPSNGAKSR